jgi:hypothetical protein
MKPRWMSRVDAMPAPQLHGNLNNARMSTKPKKVFFHIVRFEKNVTLDFSNQSDIKKIRLR